MRRCGITASSIEVIIKLAIPAKAGTHSGDRHSPMRVAGFTLVELVTVLVLVGILSVVAIPHFMDHTFDERGFHDAVKAAVQHARRIAVASRRFSCVNVTAGTGSAGIVAILRDTTVPESVTTVGCTPGCASSASCTAIALPIPGKGCASTNQVCAPSGVNVINGSSLIFDPLGRLVNASKAVQAVALPIKVSNQAGITDITVQPETGYVQ